MPTSKDSVLRSAYSVLYPTWLTQISFQAVFTVLDHINRWVRNRRQEINAVRVDPKRARTVTDLPEKEDELQLVESVLTSIDQSLMAKAALTSKAYARALMCFEQLLFVNHDGTADPSVAVQAQYEQLHEIYAHLDEPDGMEGISTMILSPSIEHQIREHESTGHWTSAQSCWEVHLQRSPNDLDSHVGLLRCLKNLGHYDTMRTHVQGILTRHPEWQSGLLGFQVESEWMLGDWDQVQSLVENSDSQASSVLFARILLAMRAGDGATLSAAVSHTRKMVGIPLMSSGAKGYKRAYDAVLDLHLVHELDMIYRAVNLGDQRDQSALDNLLRNLSSRMDSTLPAFRIREEVLAIRRAAFGLHASRLPTLKNAVDQSWLHSAKLARKSGYWQTAYSATLQARQNEVPFSFIESAKLTKASGEPIRALQELESSMKTVQPQQSGAQSGVIDLTGEPPVSEETTKMMAKARTLRARWMHESDRFESSQVLKQFTISTQQHKEWESGWFHLGQFQDDCYRALPPEEQALRGSRMNLQTVKCFAKAMRFGSKYIYQTIPRILTLWQDMAEDIATKPNDLEQFRKINQEVQRAARVLPAWKWYIAFPQIVSRVEQENEEAFDILSKIIVMVTQEYPQQALWFFVSTLFTKREQRLSRGRRIINMLKAKQDGEVNILIEATIKMFRELLALCDFKMRDKDPLKLNMPKQFPTLLALTPSPLLVPLQESLIAAVPPASSSDSGHQPFPGDYPTIANFQDEIEVMNSLAKPRKITLVGSDGKLYPFLGKPQDDLRKDARLMDFYAIINKLLQSNSESRRRRLHIRTYGVVTLNETCGFIQWVGNTRPIRHVLQKLYEGRKMQPWSSEVQGISNRCCALPPTEAAKMFTEKILNRIPPLFHEWFIENFSEPAVWFSSRLAFGRTAAVMSMVGFIIGLGDRHGENILMDLHNGDVVHVDFNCLFERGKQLDIPERVPFRLTQNMVDGFGITGVEGVFRKACEVSMQILRDHRDSLITVLDAFIHDRLSDWEIERGRLEKIQVRKWQEECKELKRRDPNALCPEKPKVKIRVVSDKLLWPVGKKFKGIHSAGKNNVERELSTPGLVQTLIQESTDIQNLSKMYMGWMSWL
ncbi:hypothetical protein QCA50_000881 [Cerrena zonata]|uniref:non-specific serine/threonine protein kinase n=1 Tax=Cerrena zonata TaxID=2478898 RepID=A0AAW0GYP8_9APHY